MKLVYVVDSVSDIKNKINMMQTRFGNNIYFVVKSPFEVLFKSFGYNVNAVYTKNLAKVLHTMLRNCSAVDDLLICYSSLNLDNQMLNTFLGKIKDNKHIVNLVPNYNFFEQIGNGTYNLYVKSMFKNKDSLASPKLQYIPKPFVENLLTNHIANRLFEIDPEFVVNVYIDNTTQKELNKSAKTKTKFGKFDIIPIIVALLITIAMVVTLAFTRPGYVFWLVIVFAYLLDIVIAVIFHCKTKFDQRFLQWLKFHNSKTKQILVIKICFIVDLPLKNHKKHLI